MAETSPLINLDLVNQIYKVINAQIAERVYNPQYYTSATLGTLDHKYVSAYISGNTSTGTLNDLTLSKASTGFTISGGTTSKTLTVANTTTIKNPLTVQADTSITGSLTVSAATNIIKNLTVGATATYTGAVTVRSAGSGGTIVTGPNGGEAILIDGTYTSIVRESFSTANTVSTLVKRDQNGDILVSKVNGVTLGNSTTSFTVAGGSSTPKTLTVNSAATLGSSTTSENGSVTVKSAGTNSTTITGPDGKEAKLINGTYTTSATTSNSDTPTAGYLLKIGTVDAKKFLAGPTSSSGIASYRTIVASDLPGELTYSNAATASQVKTMATSADAKYYISFVNSNNKDALAEDIFTNSALTYSPSTGTLGATKLVGELGAGNITGTLGVGHGGTGIDSFAAGDILYASNTSTLTVLNKGDDGQVLKLLNGEPRWGIDNTPTTFEWIDGDTEGPKGSLSGDGMIAVNFAAIPSAGEKTSGVVTVGDQSFKGVKTFTDETDSNTDCTAGAVIIKGGLSVAKNIYAAAVHNAVWNDLVDCMEVPEDTSLEYGYCYSWEGNTVIKSTRSSKNCIGIHSNTAGFAMGEKKTKTIRAAVAGFVLAYVDNLYPEGTPLTWGDDGVLTRCSSLKRILHPERVIATFYREEKEKKWHDLPVLGRHWVKIV